MAEKPGKRKYRDLSQNVLLFSISSFGSRIISFFLVPLYTSVLTTEEYGTVDLLTTTATLLIPILTVDIQDAVLRFVLDKKYKSNDVISIGFRIDLISSGILALGLLLLYVTGILNLTPELLLFLFLSFFFGCLNNCFSLYLRGTDRISILVISGLSNTLLTCVLNICFLLVFKWGLLGYLTANMAGNFFAVIYQFFVGKIYKDIHFRKTGNVTKEMVNYSSPLILNSVSWWVNNASDRYILTFLRGVAENGIYSISYKIPSILSTVQTVFYNAWSISAIKEFDKDDKDGFIGNVYSLYSVVSIIGCSIIIVFNKPLASLLYANDFFEAWQCVPFLLVGTAFNGIALFQGCLFTAIKKTKDVATSTLIGAGVNLIGNFILIYFFGALGAAFSTFLGYFVMWVIRTIMLNDFIHMKVNWPLHFVSLAILFIQSVIAVWYQAYWLQAIFVVILVILQRKYLIMTCKRGFEMVKKRLHHK